MDRRILLAAAAFSLAFQPGPPVAAKAPRIPAATLKAFKQCEAFDGLDMKAILQASAELAPVDPERIEAAHRRIRGSFDPSAIPPAQIVLMTAAGGSETQSTQTHTSSIVWLDPDGTWRFDRVDYQPDFQPAPKPPPPPGDDRPITNWTAEEVEEMRRERTSGELAGRLAESLAAALADPCFAMQPDEMPFELPVRRGAEPRDPCYGVLYGSLLVKWADGRRRLISEPCGGFYAGGAISAVLYARDEAADAALRSGW